MAEMVDYQVNTYIQCSECGKKDLNGHPMVNNLPLDELGFIKLGSRVYCYRCAMGRLCDKCGSHIGHQVVTVPALRTPGDRITELVRWFGKRGEVNG